MPILVQVVYGLISRNCRGMGICKLNGVKSVDEQAESDTHCESSLAYLEAPAGTQKLSLHFLKETISAMQAKMRFEQGYFELAEPYEVPVELANRCGREMILLAAGHYPISHTDQYITVEFT